LEGVGMNNVQMTKQKTMVLFILDEGNPFVERARFQNPPIFFVFISIVGMIPYGLQ
jgi:hypothetical protein